MRTIGEPWPELNDGLFYSDRVRPSDSGLTLVDFYSTKYKSSAPLQGWLQRIENGQITVDGTIVTDPTKVLSAASELQYHRLPWREPDAPYLLGVLFEDDHLIALNKPSGLQVLPGGLFQHRTVLTQLQWHASKQSSIFACQQTNPVPVHHLGRGTSGILLCAKTKLAKARISAYFADGTSTVGSTRIEDADISKTRKISKTYRALASGILRENEVIINQPIGMLKYPGVAKGLYVASPSELRSHCMPKYMPKMTTETNKLKEGAIGLNYPMLARSNYTAWALKMKVFMKAQGVWNAVEKKEKGGVVDDRQDKIALATIYQGIPEDVLLSLADKETAKEA
ncbi:RNA pseudouridine synthase 5-like [Apium graveolens]|uniref:RNA pseudouridine synthase 5-like n=1 Tax=Apium graveolens TaxID=4045 RepID=UPI003D7A722A